jgi:hypothetical protein
MTDRLSTADLAGGTATTRPTDAQTTTRDPMTDDRDARQMPDRDAHQRSDAFDQADATTPVRGPATVSTPQRTSGLANPAATDGTASADGETAMFPAGEVEGFRARWMEVQTGFVDEPRSAVEQADSLVAEMMKRLAQVFADERGKLEEQWSRGDDISTEDLRQALRRYRSFMDRLLAV